MCFFPCSWILCGSRVCEWVSPRNEGRTSDVHRHSLWNPLPVRRLGRQCWPVRPVGTSHTHAAVDLSFQKNRRRGENLYIIYSFRKHLHWVFETGHTEWVILANNLYTILNYYWINILIILLQNMQPRITSIKTLLHLYCSISHSDSKIFTNIALFISEVYYIFGNVLAIMIKSFYIWIYFLKLV